MIQKKICMLGGFAVGKTSLVSRFVSSIFSDKYLTTVGVKIDKKPVSVDGRDVTLMLWDIYGQDDFQTVQPSQLRGMAGYLLVVDGTRRATLDVARQLQAEGHAGGRPGAVPAPVEQVRPRRRVGDRRSRRSSSSPKRAGAS